MSKRTISGILLTLLLVSILVLIFNIQPVRAKPKTNYVDDDNILGPWDGSPEHPYQNITSALEYTVTNDTIFVYSGTYHEEVVVNKTVSIIGEDPNNTIIDGAGGIGHALEVIDTNGVLVKGFTMRNGFWSGLHVDHYVSNCVVYENIITSNGYWGIYVEGSNNNITRNTVTSHDFHGIYVVGHGDNNLIINNTVSNSSGNGIFLSSSDDNRVSDNRVFVNHRDIALSDSSGNVIFNNEATNAEHGVYMETSNNNTVRVNKISGNNFGICLINSYFSIIYHNNLIDNVEQIYSNESLGTAWDNGAEGNYWSNHDCIDSDSDGICDNSYVINENNQDNNPLVGMFSDFYVIQQEETYQVTTICNSTISKFQFDDVARTISFNVTGTDYTMGICRVTIPNIIVQRLWQGNYIVVVDKTEPVTIRNWTDGTYTYIYFTYRHSTHKVVIQAPPPIISILSPENKTYPVNNVPLTFTISEPTSWIGYTLNGQNNVSVTGNTTIAGLSDGAYTITVYANDTAGNMEYSDTVYFNIDTVPPNIEVLSPENKTYTTSSVSLSFSVDEVTSWVGYSLDSQMNVTITGNTAISELSDGPHSLIVYATDTAGNTKASEIIHFSIETPIAEPPPPEPFPIWIVAAIVIIAVVGAVLLVYFTKIKKTPEKVK